LKGLQVAEAAIVPVGGDDGVTVRQKDTRDG
jgi:hypothetical protein